jgi:hypothetical protein
MVECRPLKPEAAGSTPASDAVPFPVLPVRGTLADRQSAFRTFRRVAGLGYRIEARGRGFESRLRLHLPE